MTNPQKGIWSFYNSRHDQSTMGIDPMNNISNNNKNTLCSYIISTLPLNKKGILQHHQAIERGHHQQHQVGERTASSISSWNTDWRIYKSSEVFFIGSIVILKGMQSSSTSICISIKLIHHHHHHSTRLAHHNNTRLALHHGYQDGSTVLVSSHILALRHRCQAGSKMLVLLYVTTIRSEAGY
jgi:hypothetical protein